MLFHWPSCWGCSSLECFCFLFSTLIFFLGRRRSALHRCFSNLGSALMISPCSWLCCLQAGCFSIFWTGCSSWIGTRLFDWGFSAASTEPRRGIYIFGFSYFWTFPVSVRRSCGVRSRRGWPSRWIWFLARFSDTFGGKGLFPLLFEGLKHTDFLEFLLGGCHWSGLGGVVPMLPQT